MKLLLYQLLDLLCCSELPIIIVGDFNLPGIEWSTHVSPSASSIYMEFIRFVEENGLLQCVDEPTRLENILDLVLCSDHLSISRVAVQESFGASDHSSLQFQFQFSSGSNVDEEMEFRRMDLPQTQILLSAIDWTFLFGNCADVEQMWSMFSATIDKRFPANCACG